ncbi:CRISPR-associated endonuclease Cas3'' [Thermofilum sp.]|uniref:CRISPR-associated endonuclease Cas3'' n=1 Tax=Thermofilum sp. TaxID=1961369 RepID=UPI003164849D
MAIINNGTACAYYENDSCKETLCEHTQRILNVWDKCVARYYLRALIRVLGDYARLLMDIALLMHDTGKLVNAYAEPRYRRFYRHEIVSAYYTYEMLRCLNIPSNEHEYIIPLTVLLHHEPGILGKYAGEIGERYVTFSTIKAMLENIPSDKLKPTRDSTFEHLICDRLSKHNINFNNCMSCLDQILSDKNHNGIESVVKNLLAKALHSDVSRRSIIRTRVAAVLHPLVLSDSLAAYLGRKDSGTWVVRRALGMDLDSPAEPRTIASCIMNSTIHVTDICQEHGTF